LPIQTTQACGRGLHDHAEAILKFYPKQVNRKDNFARTPLQYAIEGQHIDVIELLIKNGAEKAYYWICVNKTEFDFAQKIFDVFVDQKGDDALSALIKKDDKKLSFQVKQTLDPQLIPFVKLHLER